MRGGYWLNRKYRIYIGQYDKVTENIYADGQLKDYKVFCFDGIPKMIEVDFDRFTLEHKRNLYSVDWIPMQTEILYPSDHGREIERPYCLDELLDLSSKLSEGIPHVRVDFYIVRDHIYFGELTFYHGSGSEEFRPDGFGREVGSWLRIP